MKYFIYCDESGESSFSERSVYEYFTICTLTVGDNKKNKINIETTARGTAFEKGVTISLDIKHDESRINYGLQAVDIISWSIYRKIAKNDLRFFKAFEELIQIKDEWYCK